MLNFVFQAFNCSWWDDLVLLVGIICMLSYGSSDCKFINNLVESRLQNDQLVFVDMCQFPNVWESPLSSHSFSCARLSKRQDLGTINAAASCLHFPNRGIDE